MATATLGHFPGPQYDVRPLTTIEDVFATVQSGQATYGVVPFENSSNGSVVFTLDLFADLHGRYPDILVWDEIYLAVHHCLLGHIPATEPAAKSAKVQEDSREEGKGPDATTTLPHLPPHQHQPPSQSGQITPTQAVPQPATARTQPSHPLTHVKKLYSHPQAWGQCKNFLAAYLKGVERQDVSSTSKAAQLVGEDTSGTSAAISSRIAAELNGLDVLAQGIEDNEGNSTRFFVVRRQSSSDVAAGRTAAEDGQGTATADDQGGQATAEFKTLVSFTVDHGSAGALAECLEIFKKYGLNLTSINTRPSGEAAWHYIFFVEFMGRKLAEGRGGAVNEALQELDRVAKSWRWLGSWENALLKP
ncbi:hypothetical protein D0860_02840 [Hortaea werneckii]|uniref:prephenate dehydratase n=1 Tax=Hortaea werneckii TaxID=91943 RepID=A0A3M7HH57_HORWE|nr:hypothetical protein D0860_02840 [Hortaea werneckii]